LILKKVLLSIFNYNYKGKRNILIATSICSRGLDIV